MARHASGMVLAIDFPDRKSAEQFIAAEPYNKAGIFESVVIRKVHKIFPETDPSIFDDMLKAGCDAPIACSQAERIDAPQKTVAMCSTAGLRSGL